MLSHDRIWAAIDRLARTLRHVHLGLTRKSGLDAASFNRCKAARTRTGATLAFPPSRSPSAARHRREP